MYRTRTVHGFMNHTHRQANNYVLARLALDSTNAPYSGAIMAAELTGQTLPVPTLHSSSLATVTTFDLRASIIMTLLSNSVIANDVTSHNVTGKVFSSQSASSCCAGRESSTSHFGRMSCLGLYTTQQMPKTGRSREECHMGFKAMSNPVDAQRP